jgi:hypothetical protein
VTRKLALSAVLLSIMLSFALPAPADAAVRRICTKSATVRDTPGGFAIARLYRRQRIRVVGASAAKGWSRVETTSGLPGWILTRSLCRG